nr:MULTISPECIES: DUF5919 domain-containing protein [Microbispora]
MTEQPIMLKSLLRQRHWQTYSTFCREYDKAAKKVDPTLAGKGPSRAQLHRWLSGELKGLPYADHCRVLEAMFPGLTAHQLFSAETAAAAVAAVPAPRSTQDNTPAPDPCEDARFADVTAVFSSRSAFGAAYPPASLLDGAKEINACGLSLNVICQSYPDHQLTRLLEGGTRIRCLFLDPKARPSRPASAKSTTQTAPSRR